MPSTRHAWTKLALHRYRCTRCGIEKEHVEAPVDQPFGLPRWVAAFTRDGVPVAQGRTPPCPGEPPAPDLVWGERDGHVQRAHTGHQVSAAKVPGGWRFVAWPPAGPLLGAFDSAAEARRACAIDARQRPPA